MFERALRQLEPFTRLDWDSLTSVAQHARLVRLAAGRRISAPPPPNDWFCYLLEGSVRIDSGAAGTTTLAATASSARLPLFGPDRQARTATTLDASSVLWVHVAPIAFLLDTLMHGGLEATWLDDRVEPGGWPERFLERGFAHGPPALLARIFGALEPIDFASPDVVLEEGDPGSDFFIVAAGRVEIRRSTGLQTILEAGDAFGEDAILQDGRRNASVRFLAPGRLMRLDERAFRGFVVPASVRWVARLEIEPDSDLIDLDAAARSVPNLDPRRLLARLSRSRPLAVAGGTRDERAHWAMLAARTGFRIVAADD